MKVFVLLVLLMAVPAGAQHAEEREHDGETETRNELGVFFGGLSNLAADETGPSLGVDYTRELSERLGIGVMTEFARAGEREALVAASFVVRTASALTLVVAPGLLVERIEEHHESEETRGARRNAGFVLRLGVRYVFEWSRVTLAPTFYTDVLESSTGGATTHLVYGVSIGFPF